MLPAAEFDFSWITTNTFGSNSYLCAIHCSMQVNGQ